MVVVVVVVVDRTPVAAAAAARVPGVEAAVDNIPRQVARRSIRRRMLHPRAEHLEIKRPMAVNARQSVARRLSVSPTIHPEPRAPALHAPRMPEPERTLQLRVVRLLVWRVIPPAAREVVQGPSLAEQELVPRIPAIRAVRESVNSAQAASAARMPSQGHERTRG